MPPPDLPAAAVPSADAPEAAADNEIVVTGEPMTPERYDQAVKEFVHDLGRPGPIGQISRWGEPVCPTTTGLSAPLNDFVTRRIKEVAERAGAPGPADCQKANVLVIFTTEPDRLMANVRDHHQELLGYHFTGQTKALAAFQPPMKSWYVTATLIPGSYAAIDYAYNPAPPGRLGSRIRPYYQSRFGFALVVIDTKLIDGQEIGPVADKIAMLALSSPAPRGGCSALPSVMDLLEPACPAGGPSDGLTDYDAAFLKGLYAFDRNEVRGFMRGRIGKALTEEVKPAAPGSASR